MIKGSEITGAGSSGVPVAGDVQLRLAAAGDAAALSKLGTDSFIAKFGHMYRPEDLSSFLDEVHSETAIAAELANPDRLYCLAIRDGRLAAYCKLGLTCGFPEYARGNRVIELKQLYTDPAMTGGGIGAALMDWALGVAQDRAADEIQLSVWSGNFGAQKFYARYGFAKVADVTFPVGEQIDEEFLFARML
jgi:ribosomal protein S18 acetylase RimI-like enzyme